MPQLGPLGKKVISIIQKWKSGKSPKDAKNLILALKDISGSSPSPKEFAEKLLVLFLKNNYPKIAKVYERLKSAKAIKDEEEEMKAVAELFSRVLEKPEDEALQLKAKAEVKELMDRFPIYGDL